MHELKIEPKWFDDVRNHKKNFEVRKYDRNYNVGDLVHLREFKDGEYTGRQVCRRIEYILEGGSYGLEEGYCILGLENWFMKG